MCKWFTRTMVSSIGSGWPDISVYLFPTDSTRAKTIFISSWTCCSSTLIVSQRRSSLASTSGSVLGELHKGIWHLSFETNYLCGGHLHWLYFILRTRSLFARMIEHATMVKCDFLYPGRVIPPCVQRIYMRKTENILPSLSSYFLWEGVTFSNSISAWDLVPQLIKRTTDF